MLESFLLVGGLVGVACCIKRASQEHVMTWEELLDHSSSPLGDVTVIGPTIEKL